MAKRVTYVSDFSGNEVDEVESVTFELNGERFKLDMSASERAGLSEAMAVYVDAGRAFKGANGATPTEVGDDPRAIRASLRAHGHTVSDRGRISEDLMATYRQIKADEKANA